MTPELASAIALYRNWYQPLQSRYPDHRLGHWMNQNWLHATDHNQFPNGALMPRGIRKEIREAFISCYEPENLEAKVREYFSNSPEKALKAIALLRDNREHLSDRETLNRIWEIVDGGNISSALLDEIEWLRAQIERYHVETHPDDKQPLFTPVVDMSQFANIPSSGYFG